MFTITKSISIGSIFEGVSPSLLFSKQDQYLAGIAIDPDLPASDAAADFKTAGIIRPAAYARINGTHVTAAPTFLVAPSTTSIVFCYDFAGNLVSYADSLGTLSSETLQRAVTGSHGNGLETYSQYLFYAQDGDIGRYDLVSTFVDTFWSGLSLGSLTNTGGGLFNRRDSTQYPNHVLHTHIDNKLYILDGQFIHYIKLDSSGSNSGSAYKALTLPYGYNAYDIRSYGNSVVICASTAGSVDTPAVSALFFWDTVSTSFTTFVRIPDKFTTAMLYMNGTLYGWSGSTDSTNGYTRFWKYLGGDSIQTLEIVDDSVPPARGAVVGDGERVMWGGHLVYPEAASVVFAYGTKSGLFPLGLHCIARSSCTTTSSNGHVSALASIYATQKSFPRLAIGAYNSNLTTPRIDILSTSYQRSIWRSQVYNVGQDFTVSKITLPLAQAIAANMTITPVLHFDHDSVQGTGNDINSTNYPNSEKIIRLTSDNFTDVSSGKINFFLELIFTGSALAAVSLPIEIDIELDEEV